MPDVLFVGREREKELYHKFLSKDSPWVLIIIGLGGIGKSTLLHRLVDYTLIELALPDTGIAMLDFANEDLRNDPLKILTKLAGDTTPYCNLLQIDTTVTDELQQNIDQLTQLSTQRTQTGVDESQDMVLQEIHHQMRELATEGFYTQLKAYQLARLVIILDTCEWLNEPEGQEVGQWFFNELLPGIRNRMRQQKQQCSVVMASRIPPRLDVINGREQRRVTLPMLGKAEVDQYLEHMGMENPALRQRVFDITHGHALCVSIIGDFWRNRSSETSQPLTMEDLPELANFSEIALMRFTNERVLQQLKSPFKELTSYGVLLRSFDLPFLRSIFPELLPEPQALERFNQLTRYPYIESRGNYRYAFHELLREALAVEIQKTEPEKWQCYHQRAFDYLTQVSPHSPDRYYHLLACNEPQGMLAWQQAMHEAGSKRDLTGSLLQAALDKALNLSPAAYAEIQYEQGRFNYRAVQWDEALKNYQEALTASQKIDDHVGQAKVLQAIGDVQRVLSKLDEALVSYEQALVSFRQISDISGEARVLQAIGDVQQLRDQSAIALQSYQQALALFRQIHHQVEEAKVLEMVGDVQRSLGEQDAALHSYQQALALYQEEKDRLKRAKVLKTIGDIQRLADKNAALESYGQALALFSELKEPTEEANIQQAIYEVQQPERESAKLPESSQQAVLNGPSGSITLGNIPINIGRLPTNQLVVNDSKVSAHHATIRPAASGHAISDLGSSNGTFLNDRRLTPQVPYTLNLGDKIRLGDTIFTYDTPSKLPVTSSLDHESSVKGEAIQQNIAAFHSQSPAPVTPSLPPNIPYSTPPANYAIPPTIPSPTRRGAFRGSGLLLITLALLLIIVSGSFIYFVTVTHPAQVQAQATAILQTKSPATPTAEDNANGTATALAQATATVTNPQAIYTQVTSGKPAFSDTMSHQNANQWDEDTECAFIGGKYHVQVQGTNYFGYCTGGTATFSNFVYQVQMTIIKGDYGGIVFRFNARKFYYFRIGIDGSYGLYLYKGIPGSFGPELQGGSSPTIHTGLNQSNLVAVMAQGSSFYLYVNRQYITSVNDSTYSSGYIGVIAVPGHTLTEIAFSNAQLWKL